jgi:hypothetical protein
MSLANLLKKGWSRQSATAISAIPATDGSKVATDDLKIAEIARIAEANLEKLPANDSAATPPMVSEVAFSNLVSIETVVTNAAVTNQVTKEKAVANAAVDKSIATETAVNAVLVSAKVSADEAVSKEAVSDAVSKEKAVSEREIVEANAELQYKVRIAHRVDTETAVLDPDRWSYPHSSAMNGAEIDTFIARQDRFASKGLPLLEAESLADKLVLRDRDMDDRRLCLECNHLGGYGQISWRCANWQAAGVASRSRDAQLPRDLVCTLQRCAGFNDALLPKT